MNEINEVSGIDGMIRDGRVPVCIYYSLAYNSKQIRSDEREMGRKTNLTVIGCDLYHDIIMLARVLYVRSLICRRE